MTREEYIKFANALKNNYTIDFDKLPEFCDMAISALSEIKRNWIPVSERLPEKNTKVYLACCDDGYVTSIMYDSGRWLINGTNVIAWMPLPEPYKAERGE